MTERPSRDLLVTIIVGMFLAVTSVSAQQSTDRKERVDRFRQLEEILPTPNEYRSASGAAGPAYWQQRADYVIDVEIDEEKHELRGSETITYHNRSPDTLRYLWVQLDQNRFDPASDSAMTSTRSGFGRTSFRSLRSLLYRREFPGGHRILSVRDAGGKDLPHTIVRTMMRIDLPEPLESEASISFSIDWQYSIINADLHRARSGYELFEEDGNAIYEMAQWFPRMAPYTDVHGWHHKQFLGHGEFSLEFGDYLVRITVPDDHVVASTGALQNPDNILSPLQRERLAKARAGTEKPIFIITPEEAEKNESSKPSGKKTWIYHAAKVRDFAFATSRKFIQDAWLHESGGRPVLAMSYWPKEGEPLWSQYSTQAIVHTLEVYSRYTFDYPYPVAISVNGPVGGMEYPMICFNGPRPEKDGTYSKRTKHGLISVIIHEVGHNYFPMIVNSDERQWTWMDEGLNTFVQYLAEQEWQEDYGALRGEPSKIVPYMRSSAQVPIMTNSESILQFGNNAYAKPATALNILRETILGRELFDFAFREYARRWKFRRPMPADFFRTMEDASGVDLDWFWRGWFYTTDPCDLAIVNLREFELDTGDPDKDRAKDRAERDARPETLSQQRNKSLPKRTEAFPELEDFYNEYDPLVVTDAEREKFQKFLAGLADKDRSLLENPFRFYVVDLENHGGLPMPVILQVLYEDGTQSEVRIPAEIWRRNNERVSKLLVERKQVTAIVLDPHLETADIDLSDNRFPPLPVKSRFKLFKEKRPSNTMREEQRRRKKEAEKKEPKENPTAATRTF